MCEKAMAIMIGIQGSGKSTRARNWAKEDPTNRIRINKVISNSLGGLNILYDVNVIVTKI